MIVGYNFVTQTYNTLLLPIEMDLTSISTSDVYIRINYNSQLLTHYFDIEDNVELCATCVVSVLLTKLVCMNGIITIHPAFHTRLQETHFVTICSILMWLNVMVMSLSHPTLKTNISCIGFKYKLL